VPELYAVWVKFFEDQVNAISWDEEPEKVRVVCFSVMAM
jgi:hypothetical protein